MHLVGEMHQNFLRDLNDLKSTSHLLDSGGPCCQQLLWGNWHRPDSPGSAASCWSGCSRGTMWLKGAPLHPSLLASWYGIGNAKYKLSTVNRERDGSVTSKWYCPSLLLEFDYVLILPLRYVALTMRFALVGRSCDSEALFALFYPWCGGQRALGQNPVWERSQSRVCLFLKSIFRITVCAQYVSGNVEITVSPCQRPVCCLQSCSCRPPQTDSQSQFEATWEEPGLRFWRIPIEIKIIPQTIVRLKALESHVWWSFYLKAATSARV